VDPDKQQTRSGPPDSAATNDDSRLAVEEDAAEQLVARCQAELPDTLDAYLQLVGRYENVVFSTAMRMLGQAQEAEEVSQDTFLRVFHKIHQFEGRSTFKTWLFRIVF
jgi:hypothetical protein